MKLDLAELVGPYEPSGSTAMRVGKFLAAALDDPFHATTAVGLSLYAAGRVARTRSTYGIRRAILDLAEGKRRVRELADELSSLRS
ncbi:hypothetical protein HS1genome_1458 [Sulfodiicoccus acidiphilus]|uniref:Uncharacterized protein n=1 Tax=Sulfodiicoccus acidiphilus TaxID=1670455 RepID=A0A348B4G7_9CREN|nr:hypothetical protein [Sulfodiicoccus acidiphilus]BBD73069.1 hypothetical protein HS1genome_1458 [Sulfodiicoccus acidiphilus]GGU04029.1 hypothetical protein GCM10007116_21040 [Sulfodiicoccus acidiphilus]